MLKKSNMKTLAVALCATTMTGLYAMTADAQELYVKDNGFFGERVTVSGTEKNKITSIEGLNSIQIGDTKLTSQNIVTKGDLQTAVNKAVDNKGFVNQVDQKIVDDAQNTAIKANTSAIEENKAAIAKKANAENVYTKAEIDAKDFQTATDVSATVNAAVANKADKADLKDFVTNEAVADVSKSIRDDFQKADNALKGELEQTIKNEVDQKADKEALKNYVTNKQMIVNNSILWDEMDKETNQRIEADDQEKAAREAADKTLQEGVNKAQASADAANLKNTEQDKAIKANASAIEANKAASEAMDSTLLAGITGVKNKLEQAKSDIADNTGKINANTAAIEANRVASEAMDNTLLAGITGVKGKLEQAQKEISDNSAQIVVNTNKITDNAANIKANSAAIEALDKQHTEDIVNVKENISNNYLQNEANKKAIESEVNRATKAEAEIAKRAEEAVEIGTNAQNNAAHAIIDNARQDKEIKANADAIAQEKVDRIANDNELKQIIGDEEFTRADADRVLDNKIKTNAEAIAQEKADRVAADAELQIGVDVAQSSADAANLKNAEQDKALAKHELDIENAARNNERQDKVIEANTSAIEANKVAQAEKDAAQDAEIAKGDRINGIQNKQIGNLQSANLDQDKAIKANTSAIEANKVAQAEKDAAQDAEIAKGDRINGIQNKQIGNLQSANLDQDKAIATNSKDIKVNAEAIAQEKVDRIANDNELKQRIGDEEFTRADADRVLDNKIKTNAEALAQEKVDRIANDNELKQRIGDEEFTRADADRVLDNKIKTNAEAIAQEKVDRIANDNELKQRIGDEEFTRADADRVLDNKIKTNAEALAQEKADRVAADAELQAGVDVAQASADAANLKNAEQDKVLAKHELDIENAARNNERQDKEIKANAETIAQEKADRVAADTKLQGNLDAEAAARAEADTKLQGNLDAEAAARAEADTKLQGNLDAEAAARAEADIKLQGNIDAEAAARAEADTKIQGNIDAEAAARAEADTKLQGNIDAEAAARAEADTKLQKNIDAEAKVRAEADTKLQENIDAEAKVRAEADTKLQGNIDKEAGLREAADTRLDNRITSLDGKVEKVGAGAAALAALHPMDFDADDKLSFAAGVGNYGSETASALGVFYRPTEKVMLSAAGTLGTGENMVNMGLSFALDKKNNVSNTRVAMAQEIVDLRAHVAQQEVQIQKLMLMVAKLSNTDGVAAEAAVAAEAMAPKAAEMFPDVPENHWAYDYIAELQAAGVLEGYENGYFEGDKTMTRYEFAAMLFRAMEKGVILNSQISEEFKNELGRIRVDRIKGLDADTSKVERVRVVSDGNRDDYGYQLD